MELEVLNIKGDTIGKVAVDEAALLGPPVSKAVVHEVVRAYLANQRAGGADTLTRSEVTGGGHKPWKQKHTGRARQGSIRSPLWRKGGITFGPHPRDYAQRLPAAKRLAALRSALRTKFEDGSCRIVEAFSIRESKTKLVAETLRKVGAERPFLLVVSAWDTTLWRGMRNIPDVSLREVRNLNAYDCMTARRIVFTKEAFEALPVRLGAEARS